MTMEYTYFAASHAHQSVIEAHRSEREELASVAEGAGNNRQRRIGKMKRIFVGLCRKEDSNLHPLARTRT